jgi:hypothetical protein
MSNQFGYSDGRVPLNPGSTADPVATGQFPDNQSSVNLPAGVVDYASPNPSNYEDYCKRGFRGPNRCFQDGVEIFPDHLKEKP